MSRVFFRFEFFDSFIQTLLSAAVLPQSFSFLIVFLVHLVHKVSPGWVAREKL